MTRGEFVCVIGHSGCGKTTVLNILAGLDTPSTGAVIVDARRSKVPASTAAVIFRVMRCCRGARCWATSLCGVVAPSRLGKAQIAKHAQKFIDLVASPAPNIKRPAELSGGMKQRVGIARALSDRAEDHADGRSRSRRSTR